MKAKDREIFVIVEEELGILTMPFGPLGEVPMTFLRTKLELLRSAAQVLADEKGKRIHIYRCQVNSHLIANAVIVIGRGAKLIESLHPKAKPKTKTKL